MRRERFEVTGNTFDDPKIALSADVMYDGPAFLKELVRGLVINGAWFLIGTVKEVRGLRIAQVVAQRHGDPLLHWSQGRVVFVAGPVINDFVLGRFFDG